MWGSRVLCVISKSLWESFSDVPSLDANWILSGHTSIG